MKVNITETVLRDANQSLIATRMPFSDFEDILEKLDDAGYYSLECWGGATFDSCLRYLNEDPWERLRKIKAKVKKTPLQMLLRGQNLLGYKHYPDDVVRLFIRKSAENGMDIFRIFDALNDFRNIEVCIDEVKKCGKHAQGCICYTTSPVHTLEKYVEMCKELVNMGVDSIAIKDMAGICSPKEAYDLVKAIKDAKISVPLFFHTHHTTGMGPMTLMKAIEAGVDGIDCAISSFAGGTSQPCTETMAYTMGQFGYESGLNTDLLKEIADFFVPVRKKFLDNGTLNPTVMGIKADILKYQVPGGMLSNMIANLKDMNALDKFDEALAEIPAVRKDMGYPPLVTPLSQMVGNQAVQNVLLGERYKNISKEIKAYLRGEYGRAPGEVSQELIDRCWKPEEIVKGRFADTLEPVFEKTKAELGKRARSDEDVLSYIAFPQVAEKYFDFREEQESNTVNYTIEKKED
ncbi:MAG: pyruvate carboxylase subunit B [Clostridiales bacterium]|nr:pyruvate carboxylase subunit B [Clostridiales bacterium]MBR4010925.1 pyruvate carboxylase subunit B [Clostridiales bacterium]